MHRLTLWGLTAALLLSIGLTARAGDPIEVRSPSYDTGFRRWNGIPPERPKLPVPPAAVERAEKKAKETAAAVRAQEEANFLRRLAVCDQLRKVALETGDDDLEKQGDVLQAKAETVYKQKTAGGLSNKGSIDGDESRAERRGGRGANQEGKR